MHRAEQIIAAVASSIAAQPDIAAMVENHREISFDPEVQELPAVAVRYGADSPLDDDGSTNLSFIDSILEIRVSAYANESTERDSVRELSRIRAVVHRALLGTDRTQGLSFVMDTRYGGTEKPEIETGSSKVPAMQEFIFFALYRMNITDPE